MKLTLEHSGLNLLYVEWGAEAYISSLKNIIYINVVTLIKIKINKKI